LSIRQYLKAKDEADAKGFQLWKTRTLHTPKMKRALRMKRPREIQVTQCFAPAL